MGQFYNGIHEQIHFAELSQKICLYTCTYINDYIYVFIRGLPRLDASGEHKLFVTKQGKNGQSDYRLFINSDKGPLFEKKIMALNGLHLFIHSHPTTPSKIRYSTEIYMELIM